MVQPCHENGSNFTARIQQINMFTVCERTSLHMKDKQHLQRNILVHFNTQQVETFSRGVLCDLWFLQWWKSLLFLLLLCVKSLSSNALKRFFANLSETLSDLSTEISLQNGDSRWLFTKLMSIRRYQPTEVPSMWLHLRAFKEPVYWENPGEQVYMHVGNLVVLHTHGRIIKSFLG